MKRLTTKYLNVISETEIRCSVYSFSFYLMFSAARQSWTYYQYIGGLIMRLIQPRPSTNQRPVSGHVISLDQSEGQTSFQKMVRSRKTSITDTRKSPKIGGGSFKEGGTDLSYSKYFQDSTTSCPFMDRDIILTSTSNVLWVAQN